MSSAMLDVERAREIVAGMTEHELRDAVQYCVELVTAIDPDRIEDDRLVIHGLRALATLVLHGRETGAWENIAHARLMKPSVDHEHQQRDIDLARALAGDPAAGEGE